VEKHQKQFQAASSSPDHAFVSLRDQTKSAIFIVMMYFDLNLRQIPSDKRKVTLLDHAFRAKLMG